MDHLTQLRSRLLRGEAIVAGVLSGTSADGIDVVLLRPAPLRASAEASEPGPGDPGPGDPGPGDLGPGEWLAFETLPFEPALVARLRALLDGAEPGLAEVARLHRDLGRAFGRALVEVAADAGLRPELAGSHGQTVWHHDGAGPGGPATLQLGDGDFVAEEAGCAVVSDFRQRDLARGGEGAPLLGAVDPLLFPQLAARAASGAGAGVLNLGGMANLTLFAGPGRRLLSFDTGPAGALLDGLARRRLGQPFDSGGAEAERGRVRPELVARFLDHPFFAAGPPKSTGRDTFGEHWLDQLEPHLAAYPAADQLASAAASVARAVADALAATEGAPGPGGPAPVGPRPREPGPVELVLAGGGVHHRPLVAALAHFLAEAGHPAPRSAADLGVDPDGREAAGFALLAVRCVLGLSAAPGGDPGTGARPGGLMGKLSPAAPPRP